MNERLTPDERIRRKKDFISLYRDGSRLRGRYFNLVFRPNELGFSRQAVVVSRKVGKAVARNRVKRRVRELFRRNKALLPRPFDLIVVAKPEITAIGLTELRAAYFEALRAIDRQRTAR